MPSYMTPIQSFNSTGIGAIGYNFVGDIVADGFGIVDVYYPMARAIHTTGNPDEFSRRFGRALAGDRSAIGCVFSQNISSLSITEKGVWAELDMPEDSYEVKMTFDEFLPILKDWENAWAAAQEYKKTLG